MEKIRSTAKKHIGIDYNALAAFLFLFAVILYLEIISRIFTVKASYSRVSLFITVIVSLASAAAITLLSSITKHRIVNTVIAGFLLEIYSFYFCLQYFMKRCYNMIMDLKTIFSGAQGAVTEGSSIASEMLEQSGYMILVFHIPLILLILLACFKKLNFTRRTAISYAGLAAVFVFFEVLAIIFMLTYSGTKEKVTIQFDTNQTTKSCSLQTTLKLDVLYALFGNPWKQGFTYDSSDTDTWQTLDASIYNMIEIDFDELAENTYNSNIAAINEYISTLTPGETNEYTGLFEGMNLIQITAESFTSYVVDEELTPTLYMLATEGIIFEDYYQPLWTGSTTTAEFQIMTGLIPYDGYKTMKDTIDTNMYFSLGNQTLKLGYTTYAFHNGTYNYYKRYLTHVNLGYSEFYANGQGMDNLTGKSEWRQSDLEMMEFIAPDFLEDEPFNIYAITLSGHSTYSLRNSIDASHYDEVAEWAEENGYDYSTATLCYLAGNLEVELALEYLIEQLEENDLLDNTVIVLTGDHYPYSLTDSFQYDEDGNIIQTEIEENIAELFGFTPETQEDYNHGALYIWSPVLDELAEQIVVSTPVSSVDILPTLSNLFGLEFDTRFLAGRDALDDSAQALVVFSDYSWKTDVGFYNADTGILTLTDGTAADSSYDSYIEEITTLVNNRAVLSEYIVTYDYYEAVFGE